LEIARGKQASSNAGIRNQGPLSWVYPHRLIVMPGHYGAGGKKKPNGKKKGMKKGSKKM
jgi:hypothetical protein